MELTFAGLARCGFIAMEILIHLEKKILTDNDKLKFLSSIKTITSEMKEDIHKDKKRYKKFGPRPGTYEITSLNYKETLINILTTLIKKLIEIIKVKNLFLAKYKKIR